MNNIIQAVIGDKAIEQIINLAVESNILCSKKPQFRKDIDDEFEYEMVKIIRHSLAYKYNPQEVIELTEDANMQEFALLFGNYYASEIAKRVSARNDPQL